MEADEPPPLKAQPRQMLQSWKEIARFLGVTVRSVQRWEASGLPVHRQGEGAKARVFGYSDELREWMLSNTVAAPAPAPAAPPQSPPVFWYAVPVFGLLLLTGALIWLGRVTEPQTWSWDGSRFAVLDTAGRTLWEKRFASVETSDHSVHDRALVADIDGDGHNEVLYNLVPANINQVGGSLFCYEHTGKIRWQHQFGGIRRFGSRVFEPNYIARFVHPLKVGGKPVVLTIANHFLWYPAQAALLDPHTGRVVEEYWHPGSIYHYALHDMDADGVDELVFGAINNPGQGLGHAAVGVLKLPFSKAPPPSAPPRFPPVTGGGELAYSLFPLPDICQAAAVLPLMHDLAFDALGRLRVQLTAPETAGIVYYLDNHLSVLEFRLTDNFAPLHERLYRAHLLDHQFGPEEKAELGKLALFPAAPDGNSPEIAHLWRY